MNQQKNDEVAKNANQEKQENITQPELDRPEGPFKHSAETAGITEEEEEEEELEENDSK